MGITAAAADAAAADANAAAGAGAVLIKLPLCCPAAVRAVFFSPFFYAAQEDRRLEDMILKVAGKSPPWLANFLRAFAPFVTLAFTIANIVGPVVIKFYALLYKVPI